MSTNNSVPGLQYPTQKAMLAGNPRDSAIQSMNNSAQSQANANKALAGGKRDKYNGGAVVVPQMQMQYTPQGGPGTNPNDQITGNAKTSTQMASNSVYDNLSSNTTPQKAGSRRKRKGGNPNWKWPCLSGGRKQRKTRKQRKSRKQRKY